MLYWHMIHVWALSLKNSEASRGKQGCTGGKVWEAPPQGLDVGALRSSGVDHTDWGDLRRLQVRTWQFSRQTEQVKDIPGRRNGMYEGKEL